jgi:hypothetical protein
VVGGVVVVVGGVVVVVVALVVATEVVVGVVVVVAGGTDVVGTSSIGRTGDGWSGTYPSTASAIPALAAPATRNATSSVRRRTRPHPHPASSVEDESQMRRFSPFRGGAPGRRYAAGKRSRAGWPGNVLTSLDSAGAVLYRVCI